MKKILAIVLLVSAIPAAQAQTTSAAGMRPLTGTQEEAIAITLCHSPAAAPNQPNGLLGGYCEALAMMQVPHSVIPFDQAKYERTVGLVLAEGQRRGLLR